MVVANNEINETKNAGKSTTILMAMAMQRYDAGCIARWTSEAAPCPLQPCYFDKWDLFADIWDCQFAMGFPVCIFMYLGVSLIIFFRYFLFLDIFSCPNETVPYLRNIFFQNFGFPSIFICLYFHLI